MSSPNVYSQAFNLLPAILLQNNEETRAINDSNGNPIYIAYSMTPNASTASATWMVYKFHYDSNGFFERRQLPTLGYKYGYTVDDIATYFA